MLTIMGASGVLGGLLCAVGDIFLDLKGPDNKKLGAYKIIDSSWERMDAARFKTSIILATIGVPLYLFGFQSMAEQLKESDYIFGSVFWLFASAGSIGGYFIHAIVCLMPIIYKTMGSATFEQKEQVINSVFDAIKPPFIVLFVSLVGITSLMIAYAILVRYIQLHWLFIFLTPLSLMIIGLSLRKINKRVFIDLPGIIMPSVGISMIGLMALLNSL